MDSCISLDEKIKIDNILSNRYIDLDPNGYFIIKVDLEENKIILEHFLNNINDDGYALDPETNEPIKCDSQNKRVCNEVFEGISAKQLGILITEERNDLITKFDHALYLGRELQKAEECLFKKLPYIQDKEIKRKNLIYSSDVKLNKNKKINEHHFLFCIYRFWFWSCFRIR